MELDSIFRKLRKPRVLWTLAIINLAGSIFGFYYYIPQLMETEPSLWIWVVDSPLATLSLAVALIMRLKNRSSTLVEGFAFISNLKYGLWTCLVLLFYSEGFLLNEGLYMYLFLFFSHLGMALQSFILLEDLEFGWVVPLAGWFLLNDTLDYFLEIHPGLYAEISYPVSAAMVSAYSLSAICLILFWRFTRSS